MRTLFVTLITCLFVLPAQAQYSGGTGELNDPYQIATAEDLMLLGDSPEDYGKHFILTADIDLDPNLPGRKVFDRAVIAPDANDVENGFQGIPFTGVFDGNSRTIWSLTISGKDYLGLFGQLGATVGEVRNLQIVGVNVVGSGECVGGLVGESNNGTVANCSSHGEVMGNFYVGGLVGYNAGPVTCCYSTVKVSGSRWSIGGLVGYSCGRVQQCYSTGPVSGSSNVGGLVGENAYTVAECYSAGAVSGRNGVGGLVGYAYAYSQALLSFWDMQTSGQASSAGGTGKTTAQMQTDSTFLRAGWDFVDETANGTEDIWWIDQGKDYPHLSWELSEIAPAVGADITKPGDRIKGVPNDGDWPSNEAPRFAIDDNIATKYLHFKGDFYPDPGTGGAGFRVTPSISQTTVFGLTFTTANDYPARDPVAFELSGSNVSIDGPYSLIASGEIVDFNQRTEWPRFTKNRTPISFRNSVAYNHYQLIFTAIRGPAGGMVNSMQIAEVELLGLGLPAGDPSPSDGAL
jgi:hypothetical protein